MKTSHTLKTAVAFGIAVGAGCATAAPPADLLSARSSFRHAQESPAAKFNPSDLYTAQKALGAAEESYLNDGDTRQTRDLAYTAERRAQIAEARGYAGQSTGPDGNAGGDEAFACARGCRRRRLHRQRWWQESRGGRGWLSFRYRTGNMVRHPGAAFADRAGGAGRRILGSLVFELGIDLGAEEQNVAGEIQPGQQRRDCSQ